MKKSILSGLSLLLVGSMFTVSCDAEKKDDKKGDEKAMTACDCVDAISKAKSEEDLEGILNKCDAVLDKSTEEEIMECPTYDAAMAVIDEMSGHDHGDEEEEWVELEDYHSFMAATFHPADEGDVAPLKEKARGMADAAVVLENSTIPDHYGEEVKDILKRLREGSEAIAKKVEEGKASDKELIADIVALHEVFHEVHGACTHHDHEGHNH